MKENITPKKIRVLCVEDETIIALDLQHAINSAADMQCVGWLSKADTLAGEVQTKSPDVVLLDLSMPGRDPLEVLSEVSTLFPALRTIVCSGYSDKGLIAKAYEAGAIGYVQKSGSLEDILDLIRRVWSGESLRAE